MNEIMEPQGRQALIVELSKRLEGLSPQFGKTVLMKLLYLLQEAYGVSTGYRYSFYTYGPYSQQVTADLDITKMLGGVDVEFLGDDPGGYEISPGRKSDGVLALGRKYIDPHSKQLDELVNLFGEFRARDLELRTTIVYLSKNVDSIGSGDRDELLSVIKELKPQFSDQEIQDAVDELQGAGVVKNLSY